jgi:tetratricopeptide (TPR) repeat protein
MNLTGNNLHFRRQKRHSNTYRILILLTLLVSSLFLVRGVFFTQEIKSPFAPTAIPTRTAASFMQEGQTHFTTGNLNKAITAYQEALRLDPKNVGIAAELARIQVYSSTLLTTDRDKQTRLEDAFKTADQAVTLDSQNSMAYAARALARDWLANPTYIGDKWQENLALAGQDAVKARAYDPQNVLAMAFYAEILLDQQQITQAQQMIQTALNGNQKTMDAFRVNGAVMETLGQYGAAIKEYQKAAAITPNFTYLYIKMGVNNRQLRRYDEALVNFATAAHINEQLGVKDPIPYLSIANTYSQTGDFFAAASNVRKALSYDPSNPSVYGNLGMVFFKSRNYEGAIEALQCATLGCNSETSCSVRRCDDTVDPAIEIKGQALSDNTLLFYYTYGSALAGMSRSYNDYCSRANAILSQVRAKYSSDAVTMEIISPSEEICRNGGSNSGLSTSSSPTSIPNFNNHRFGIP